MSFNEFWKRKLCTLATLAKIGVVIVAFVAGWVTHNLFFR